MLSDVKARPAGEWRNLLTIKGKTVAAKTGTSNKITLDGKRPNNLITVGYSRSYVVLVWVGNTDNSAMNSRAYGLFGAAPIWREIMTEILADQMVDEPFEKPADIHKIGREFYPSWGGFFANVDKAF